MASVQVSTMILYQTIIRFLIRMWSDDLSTMVIDVGSLTCKAGYSGEDAPRVSFPSLIGKPYFMGEMVGMGQKAAYIGVEAQQRRLILDLGYRFQRGVVSNWEDMYKILEHTFYGELFDVPEERALLLTGSPLNPKANREKVTEMMFERFCVPVMYIADQAVLSLYSTGRINGVVLYSGNGVTYAVPVTNGYAVTDAIHDLDLAGIDIDQGLMAALSRSGYNLIQSIDVPCQCCPNKCETSILDLVRDIKKLCYVALDFDQEMFSSSSSLTLEKTYQLPDGKMVELGPERFSCPEALFQPNILGMQSVSAPQAVYNSVMKCDVSIHNELLTNIVLSGGNTKFPGFAERMQKEVQAFGSPDLETHVIAPLTRKYSPWIGGSILASLSTFQQMWISKQEYDESGPSIVHRKYF